MLKRMSDTTGEQLQQECLALCIRCLTAVAIVITRFIIEVLLYKLWNTK
jgi:hypothetical protein